MARALVTVPRTARRGEPMEVRVLISHPMETGFRPGADGKVLPRNIIRRFICRYNHDVAFAADLHPAVAANPYMSFWLMPDESGVLEFHWVGDNGFTHTETTVLAVSP